MAVGEKLPSNSSSRLDRPWLQEQDEILFAWELKNEDVEHRGEWNKKGLWGAWS